MHTLIHSWLLVALTTLGLVTSGQAQLLGDPKAPRDLDAAATLVVYNTNDPDSGELARFYAAQRGIAKEQVLGLNCPLKEEITRAEYDTLIAEPLRAAFQKNGWWELRPADHPLGRVEKNRIRFVALIRGVPLKVSLTIDYPGDKASGPPQVAAQNQASVDSELARLGAFSPIISGAIHNPYFRSYSRILDTNFPDLMLVCRLDAPTPQIVKRMITEARAAEQDGLRGFAYIDSRNILEGGLAEGDKWLMATSREARKRGFPVILDKGEGLFPQGYPMRQTALYFGWYAADLTGPFARRDFRFAPGAIAVHIHSFSATTVRDFKRGWCGPLLAAGATATLGNVYEPFLGLTPQLDIFHERLEAGFTFAESAWMAQRVSSWQSTFLGDPLYRPFRRQNEVTAAAGTTEWDRYREGAKLWFQKDRASGEEALRSAARRAKSGLIYEGLGLLELTTDDGQEAALNAFREARKAYNVTEDVLRAAIHEIILLRAMKRFEEASALAKKMTTSYPGAPALEVIVLLDPPPAPATPATPAPR